MWLVPRSPIRTPNSQYDSNRADRRRPVRGRRAIGLCPEVLEDRTLLSTNFTVTDNSDNPADPNSLRYAVINATSGSTITFASNIGAITLTNGPLDITTNVAIEGPGANSQAISANNASGIFNVTGGSPTMPVTIVGLTLTNGSAANGAGITNSGALTLAYCTVATNHASSSGGGIWNTGTMTVIDCTIDANNSAGTTGGGIENDGTMTATDSTISSDSALNGGGIYNTATLTATNCTIANNSAVSVVGTVSGQGGGIANTTGPLTLTNCTVVRNSAPTSGGGIFNSSGASAVLANTIVALNNAAPTNPNTASDIAGNVGSASTYNLIGTGGGGGLANGSNGNQVGVANPNLGTLAYNGGTTQTIALLPGSPAIDAGSDIVASNSSLNTDQRGFSRIVNNTVDIGALEVQVYTVYSTGDSGGGSLRNALSNANQAGGSVIVVTATGVIGLASALPTITQSVQILGPGANNLTVTGSGLYQIFNISSGVSATIAGLTITGGMVANNDGGGIQNAGTLTLTNCTVTNSAATGTVLNEPTGGGIYNNGTLEATNCTIANNSAVFDGGGIDNDGTATLVNCTITGNQTSGDGGGIQNEGVLSATNCTIANNLASVFGGGISVGVNSTSTTPANTIVAGNSAPSGPDISGTVSSRGYNLIGNASGSGGFVSTDLTNVNPVLGILQNNGGPTPTVALLPGSPAIAAGSVTLIPAGITTDQRGLPRTVNGKVDIGAFQSRGFTITISAGSNQRVLVNTAFASPLFVTVSSPFGDPVQGGLVTFSAPTSGASATFPNGKTSNINASGLASLVVNANNVVGTYSVTPAANGASGTNLSFSLTNLATPVKFLVSLSSSNGKFTTSTPYSIVVQAVDGSNNVTPGYRGSIQFISSELATLPGYYSFVAADNGAHTFINGVTFGQSGTVYITVYDTITHISGQVKVTVSSDPPAATTKAESRRLARKVAAATAKHKAHQAAQLQSGKASKAVQVVAATSGNSAHQAAVMARHASVVAQADAEREHILAELRGSLRAYLAAERLAGT